jgi:hypothetical protein
MVKGRRLDTPPRAIRFPTEGVSNAFFHTDPLDPRLQSTPAAVLPQWWEQVGVFRGQLEISNESGIRLGLPKSALNERRAMNFAVESFLGIVSSVR